MNENSNFMLWATAAVVAIGLGVVTLSFQQNQLAGVTSDVANLNASVDRVRSMIDASPDEDGRDVTPSYAPGEVLVKFKAGVSQTTRQQVLDRAGVSIKETIPQIDVLVLSVPEQAEQAVVEAFSRNPRFEFAELNGAGVPTYVPNDPRYSDMWHHPKISSATAWDATSAQGITIAILDTGIDSDHPDLAARIVPGYDVVNNDTDVEDPHGHGTKVAGAAAAIGDNSNQVVGIAYDAPIMPMKIIQGTDDYTYMSDVAEAITWAADNGARVANASYSTTCGSYTVSNAAQYMKDRNGLVTLAGENDGVDEGYGASDTKICVSATNSNDSRTSWSSYGDHIDVAAPGAGIYTTTLGGGISSRSGTSYAAPITAGVIALMMDVNPELPVTQIEDILFDTAVDLGATGWDPYYGWGRIDAAAAVQAAATADAPEADTTSPTTSVTHPTDGATVGGALTVTAEASDDTAVEQVSLYINGALHASDSSSPYEFYWDTMNVSNGSHTLETRAVDTSGNTGVSDSISVTVDNVSDGIEPTVTVTEPADGSTQKSKGAFTITSSASDNVRVSQIDIYFDGVIEATCVDTTSCSTNINAKKESSGSHTISSTAYDPSGNSASDQITISIGGDSKDSDDGGSGKPEKCTPWPECNKN